MLAIFKKEIWSYLGNWSAWIIIAIFSLISTLFLFFFDNNFNIFDIGTAGLQSFFILAPWIFMLIMPALSMKSIADEEQNQTLQWLFSQPVQPWEILLGKFFSIYLLGVLCLLPSLVYVYTVYIMAVPTGNIDSGMIVGSYLGSTILIGAFASLGIFASSIAKNQVLAYLIGLFLNFIFWLGFDQLASYKLMGGADYFILNLSFQYHFASFARGLIDSRDVFYFVLISLLALWAATWSLQKKKN